MSQPDKFFAFNSAQHPGDSEPTPEDLEEHLDWSHRMPTPFISVTDSVIKARRYFEQRENWGRIPFIAKIDVDVLDEMGVWYWRMLDLADDLDVVVERRARDGNEWLCWGRIPGEAVVEIFNEETLEDL